MNSFTRSYDPGTEMAKYIIITGLWEDNQKALWVNTSIGILKLKGCMTTHKRCKLFVD